MPGPEALWGGRETHSRPHPCPRPQGAETPTPSRASPGWEWSPMGGSWPTAGTKGLTCLPPSPPVAMDDEDGRCLLDVIW